MNGNMFGFVTKTKTSLLVIMLISSVMMAKGDVSANTDNEDDDDSFWDWTRHDLFEEDEHAQEHIKEDLKKVGIVDTTNMTADDLNLHYFKLHDYDENEKLDGLEILQSFMHSYYEHDIYLQKTEEERQKIIDSYVASVDDILNKNDHDNDGYLNYVEYKLAQNPNPTST